MFGARGLGSVSGIVVACLFAPAVAQAQSFVSMPFQCFVAGDRIEVPPAAETRHAIHGAREQQPFTICAGPDQRQCRTMMLHRFDLDCAGTRVPWIRVVAAAAAARPPPRAWIEEGRLVLAQGPRRVGGFGDACAGRGPWPGAVRRRIEPGFAARDCVRPPGPSNGDSVVHLPAGFAPVMFLRARFFADEVQPAPAQAPIVAAAPAAQAPRAKIPAGEPPRSIPPKVASEPAGAAVVPAARGPLVREAGAHEAGAREAGVSRAGERSASSQVAAPMPEVVKTPAAAPPATLVDGWVTSAVPARGAGGPLSGNTGLGLLALAVLLLSSTAVLARHRMARSRAAIAADATSPAEPSGAAFARETAAIETVLSAEVAPPIPPALPPELGLATGADARATTADLKATAEALGDIVHQIIAEMLPDGPVREVLAAEAAGIDRRITGAELAAALAAPSLDGARAMLEVIVEDLQRVRTLARIEHERASGLAEASDAVPASREAALAFLGLNAGAGAKVAKKVVDALRQTWHPDLARDEADRISREARMKQINGAWDAIRAGE